MDPTQYGLPGLHTPGTMASPVIEADFQTLFGDKTWERGVRYARDGRVLDLSEGEDFHYEARVSGREGRDPYEVQLAIDPQRREVHGSCTCPVDGDCKHMAAVVVTVLPSIEPWLRRGDTGTDALDQLDLWVGREARRRQPQGPVAVADVSAPTGPRSEIRYELRPVDTPNGPRLALEPQLVRLREDGAVSSQREYDLHQVISGELPRPAFVQADDLALFAKLMGLNPSARRSTPVIPATEDGFRLFNALLATGRLHEWSVDEPPLRLGPPRSGIATWWTGEHATQRPAFVGEDGEPMRLLYLRPLHYVDLDTQICGPIEADLDEETALAFVGAPLIEAHAAQSIPDALVGRLEELGLPLPARREVTYTRQRPRAVLRLITVEGPKPFGPPFIDLLGLAFQYEGVRIPGLHDEAVPAVVTDHEVLVVQRAQRAEMNRLQTLQGLGFRPREFRGLDLDPEFSYFDAEEDVWSAFVARDLPHLRRKQWAVEVDPSFRFSSEALLEPVVVAKEDGQWFKLFVGIEIDGVMVDITGEIIAAIHSGRIKTVDLAKQEAVFLVLKDGTTAGVSSARVQQIVNVLVELSAKRPHADGLRLPLNQLHRLDALPATQWHGTKEQRELARALRAVDVLPEVAAPEGLHAELRSYQLRGLSWLAFLAQHGLGGVLADDMGLGKTIQTLAHVLREKELGRCTGPSLVLAPRSVLENWAREARRFTPDLRVAIAHGPDRERFWARAGDYDLLITTYGVLVRDEILSEIPFHVVALDEAQAIKNPRTKVAAAARKLQARQRLCLTGTPIENGLMELWSLFEFLMPGTLGAAEDFRKLYVTPIERDNDVGRLRALAERVAPFVLRRTKTAVLKDLPPKTEVVRRATMSEAQRDLYEAVRLTKEKEVRKAVQEKGLASSHIVLLDALLKLRQICCYPPLAPVAEAADVAESGKLDEFLEIVGQLRQAGRRALVFSQFTSMLDVLARQLEAEGVSHLLLTGKTRDRQGLVDRFQGGEGDVFLISLKAGGTGLNLTAADAVILYDPWWNPAVEQQAADRAYRIGQDKPVTVYKLVCAGSVEERILELQARKQALAGVVADQAEARSAGSRSLTAQDLDLLFAPLDE